MSESVLDALRWRYATKVFDPSRKIPADLWDILEETLVLTPSSCGLQPWKFLVIENPTIRGQLREQSWRQSQVTDASHFVVFAARNDLVEADIENWIDRLADIQNTPVETLNPLKGSIAGFVSRMTVEDRAAWNIRQLYIALGQFMTTAAILGLDTCPLEGINPAGYDTVLGLEGTGYATAVACAIGYRSPEDSSASRPKARYAKEDVLSRIT